MAATGSDQAGSASPAGPEASTATPIGPQAVASNPASGPSGGIDQGGPAGQTAATPTTAIVTGVIQAIAPVLSAALTAPPILGASPSDHSNSEVNQGIRPHYVAQAAGGGEQIQPPTSDADGSMAGVITAVTDASAKVTPLLAEILPIDLSGLDGAFDRCLDQIEAKGDALADLVASDGAWPWLAGAAVAATAGVAASYWHRKMRFDYPSLATGEGSLASWFPDPLPRA